MVSLLIIIIFYEKKRKAEIKILESKKEDDAKKWINIFYCWGNAPL